MCLVRIVLSTVFHQLNTMNRIQSTTREITRGLGDAGECSVRNSQAGPNSGRLVLCSHPARHGPCRRNRGLHDRECRSAPIVSPWCIQSGGSRDVPSIDRAWLPATSLSSMRDGIPREVLDPTSRRLRAPRQTGPATSPPPLARYARLLLPRGVGPDRSRRMMAASEALPKGHCQGLLLPCPLKRLRNPRRFWNFASRGGVLC